MPKRYISRDGELYHANHKYKDRFWKNGRWQYVYNDAKAAVGTAKVAVRDAARAVRSKIESATGVSARRSAQRATKEANSYRADVQVNTRRALESVGSNNRNGRTANMSSATAAKIKADERSALRKQLEAESNVTRSTASYEKAKKGADEAVARYKATPLGKLETSIQKGKAKLEKLVSKLKNRKKKDEPETKKVRHKPKKVTNAAVKRKAPKSTTTGARGIASTTRTKPGNASSEYLQELEYNSRRNKRR